MRRNALTTLQPTADRFPALEEREITLRFFAPDAVRVQIAGTFNDWRPESNPIEKDVSGDWIVRLRLRSGQYEYRFMVDGAWTDDPCGNQRSPNPYGGHNSVLTVALDDRADWL
jgi:1,4-alpha-glucan branching enzyme